MEEDLGIIVMDSIKDIGKEVQKELNRIRKTDTDYIVPVRMDRFSNGEAKATIWKTVRNKDIYILTDKGNYDITYEMYGFKNHMSPDDHYQDLKRIIAAVEGKANRKYDRHFRACFGRKTAKAWLWPSSINCKGNI